MTKDGGFRVIDGRLGRVNIDGNNVFARHLERFDGGLLHYGCLALDLA